MPGRIDDPHAAPVLKTKTLLDADPLVNNVVQHVKVQYGVETLFREIDSFERVLVKPYLGFTAQVVMVFQPCSGVWQCRSGRWKVPAHRQKTHHQPGFRSPSPVRCRPPVSARWRVAHGLQNVEDIVHQAEILWIARRVVIGLGKQPGVFAVNELGGVKSRRPL